MQRYDILKWHGFWLAHAQPDECPV